MNPEVTRFVASLRFYTGPKVFNPWRSAQNDPLDVHAETAADHRRARLESHMNRDARFVLVGEAPGYQGCHFSGVPFTSERLLLEGAVPGVECSSRITRRPRPWSEPSATIVWKVLHELGIAEQTVMWNAFPWHPFKTSVYSNRAPTDTELVAGQSFLKHFLSLYLKARVVAVGRIAEGLLWNSGRAYTVVRHPANGGATQFREGLRGLI